MKTELDFQQYLVLNYWTNKLYQTLEKLEKNIGDNNIIQDVSVEFQLINIAAKHMPNNLEREKERAEQQFADTYQKEIKLEGN